MTTDPIILAKMDAAIRAALEEDMPFGDVSTMAVMPEPRPGRVQLICKQDGVVAGLSVFERTFQLIDPAARVERLVEDGAAVTCGQHLATVHADVRALLEAERVALNYLQRMSGIATYTARIARVLEGTGTRLVCTRKTTPGMRLFEREAVRLGGGHLHRYGLSDAVMLKDNHIDAAGGVRQAIEAARATAPFVAKVEVECESLDMVREAVDAGADIIMLDNMTHDAMAEAIALIGGRAITEASGNVTAQNATGYADLGVDVVSCGALRRHPRPLAQAPGGAGVSAVISGELRREKILATLSAAEAPLSGSALGRACEVSRQVVVQDIALLRTQGWPIQSTNRGYVLEREATRPSRLIKCHHTVEQTPEELNTIVDLGGHVRDVLVNHRVYGRLSCELGIASRRDVANYMTQIRSGKSSPLMLITSGYHFHHVTADCEEALDEVVRALGERGFLAPVSDYERGEFAGENPTGANPQE